MTGRKGKKLIDSTLTQCDVTHQPFYCASSALHSSPAVGGPQALRDLHNAQGTSSGERSGNSHWGKRSICIFCVYILIYW